MTEVLEPVVPHEPILMVDFDATLFPWGPLYSENPPIRGAVEAMHQLKEAGYILLIYSSRMSATWLAQSGESRERNREHMTKLLHRYDIPFDGFAIDKVPAVAYIDDKAIEFKDNWAAIAARLVPHGPKHVHEFMDLDPEDVIDDITAVCSCGRIGHYSLIPHA